MIQIRSRGFLRVLLVLLALGGSGWWAGVAMGRVGDLGGLRVKTLSAGELVPDVEVITEDGQLISLSSVLLKEAPRALVVLSSKCSSCLGEIEAWNELARSSKSLGVVALVFTRDQEYLREVRAAVATAMPLYRIEEGAIQVLEATVTPLALLLANGTEVSQTAVGMVESMSMRTLLEEEARQGRREMRIEGRSDAHRRR